MLAKKLIVPVLSLSLLVACGKKEAESTIAFPESGTSDITAISSGTYQVSRVRSYTVSEGKNMSAVFDHKFTKPGSPAKGDTVETHGHWGEVDKDKEVGQLSASINLPLQLKAESGKIEFLNKVYYTHYSRSNGSWRWYVSGEESTQGAAFHKLFDQNYRSGSGNIYSREGARATVKIQGGQVVVYYELKGDTSLGSARQVVEITYSKK